MGGIKLAMGSLFGKTSDALLGLDISSTSVRLLELTQSRGRYKVAAYAMEPLPDHAVQDRQVKDTEAVTGVIEMLVQHTKTKLRRVAIAISGAAVMTRTIELDADLREHEIEELAEAAAEQHIPYPLDEVAMDFAVLDLSKETEGKVEVLLVACRMAHLESQRVAVEAAGLQAVVADVEGYAMQRAFDRVRHELLADTRSSGQVVVLLDVEATMANVLVLADERVVFARKQSFGQFAPVPVEPSATILGADLEEVPSQNQSRITSQGWPDASAFQEALAGQIADALQFFFSSKSFQHIDLIALAGSASGAPGLTDYLQAQFDVPVLISDPFYGMGVCEHVGDDLVRREAPASLIACGLALRSF